MSKPVPYPSKSAWINALVHKRRLMGGYSEQELREYHDELTLKFAYISDKGFRAMQQKRQR